MLYHSDEAVQKYLEDKEAHPHGILEHRFGKDRLRPRKSMIPEKLS